MPRGKYNRASGKDDPASHLAHHLLNLAAAWADLSEPFEPAMAARRWLLRTLVEVIARRATPGSTTLPSLQELSGVVATPPPPARVAARLAAIEMELAGWSGDDLATALAVLTSMIAGLAGARDAHATPPALADLMAGWAVRDGTAAVLDPACGAGSLLARVAAWRAWRGTPAGAPLWGVEAEPTTAALARLALSSLGATNVSIWTADFLALPPTGPDRVGAIVANPPFVRHERLPANGITHQPVEAVNRLPGRADLHAYFWPALTGWLAPGGRVAMVMPASWLEADYGQPLRRYLTEHFALEAIVEPAAERWFAHAGIHAMLVLARCCDDAAERSAIRTRLIRLNRPLTALLGPPGPSRWAAVADLVSRLDALTASEDGPDWRVRLVMTSLGAREPRAREAGEQRSRGAEERRKERALDDLAFPCQPLLPSSPPLPGSPAPLLPWAGWLRAPAVLVDLLARWPAMWVTLGDLARVRYPLKTGADDFFFMTAAAATALGIEPQYLRPLVRTPRELTGLVVEPAELNWRVLVLPASPPEALLPGIRRYLAAGVTAGIDRRPTCAGRRPWYCLRSIAPAPLLWPRFIHERHGVWLNPTGTLENQTFYGLLLGDATLTPVLAATLNSSLGALLMEVCGRGSLGEGALQYAVAGAAAVPVPDVRQADPATRAALTEALTALAAEPDWGPLGGSTPRPARLALDDLVLALLGLTDPAERTDLGHSIRAALSRLIAERRQRGQGG